MTREQFCGSAVQLLARLRDHVARLDSGLAYASDDLAVVLRALVGSGRGNHVLARVADRTNQPLPTVQVSRAPNRDGVEISVGSIPVRFPGATVHGARTLTLRDWLQEPVAVVRAGGHRRALTWASFLADYANKWGGAHLDGEVPAFLPALDVFGAAGLSLPGYLLRTAALEVWDLGQRLLMTALVQDPQDHRVIDAVNGAGHGPADLSSRGQLQYLDIGHHQADLLWYVDRASSESDLRIPGWEIKFTPDGLEPADERPFVEQRSQIYVGAGPAYRDDLPETSMSMQIIGYDQVR